MTEKEVEQHMQRIVTQMNRNQVIDKETGRVDLRDNPKSVDEDYFIPVRGATSNTRVESLPGGTYTGDVDDVKYLRDKLFSALKIPASYLTQGEEGSEDKTTLAQRDIRFARTIKRLQRSVISELEKIAVVHLYTLGYKNKDLISFKLGLNNPSKLAELQELEHWRTKFEIASTATEGYFSRRWVNKNIFDLSDEEAVRNQREMFFDRKFDASLEAAMMPEGGEMGEGGDMAAMGGGGADPTGAADLGTDVAATGEEGEETLLAAPGMEAAGEMDMGMEAPGKRNELKWMQPDKSKGKVYTPVKDDKRDMGARKRSYHGQYSKETGKNTKRNVFKGQSELNQLARGIYENLETNYDKKHKKEDLEILKNDVEIQQIIENLEKKGDKDKQDGEI